MLAMLEDMDREGYFEEGPYTIVLYHGDLEPWNIMVQNSGDSWKICGIIDWDEAECAPRATVSQADNPKGLLKWMIDWLLGRLQALIS